MYTAFYGLKEEPFNITPDPRFLYWSPKHQEAFRHLVHSVQSNKGLAVLTGDPGTGKTAILHAVTEHLNKLYPGVHIAFLINSKISVEDLFRLIFDEFHIENTADSKGLYLIHLKNFLVHNHLKNEKCVLILDEAQNFHSSILEEIRLLSNMETSVEKLLHIFLVGQPQLIDNIRTPSLAQLKQRLGIMYNLLPLNRQEMELYIHKRLNVAGAHEVDIFNSDALDEIFVRAKGLPRLINVICDNALLFGCAANTYHITPDIIRRVAQDMDINTLEESDATGSGLLARPPERRTLTSPVAPPPPPPADWQEAQSSALKEPKSTMGDDADRFIILQNTALAEQNYWDNLLGKSSSNENHLVHIWKEAAEREARQRLMRFIIICVALLGLLGAIGGEQLGLWSLRAAAGHAWERVTRQATLLLGTAVPPEAVGGRDQEQQKAALLKQDLPATMYGNERAKAGDAATSSPQALQRKRTAEGSGSLAPSGAVSGISATTAPSLPSSQPSTTAQVQQADREKVKKVVVIRLGDTLSKILIQEYGEYTKAVVDSVIKANPGLGNIHFLEVGQRLILPERPE